MNSERMEVIAVVAWARVRVGVGREAGAVATAEAVEERVLRELIVRERKLKGKKGRERRGTEDGRENQKQNQSLLSFRISHLLYLSHFKLR